MAREFGNLMKIEGGHGADLTEEEVRELSPKLETSYAPQKVATRFVLDWQCGRERRSHEVLVPDSTAMHLKGKIPLSEISGKVDFRAELYRHRLCHHFKPAVIKDVKMEGSIVRVTFSNNQQVSCHESNLLDKEFLARCAMVYDL